MKNQPCDSEDFYSIHDIRKDIKKSAKKCLEEKDLARFNKKYEECKFKHEYIKLLKDSDIPKSKYKYILEKENEHMKLFKNKCIFDNKGTKCGQYCAGKFCDEHLSFFNECKLRNKQQEDRDFDDSE